MKTYKISLNKVQGQWEMSVDKGDPHKPGSYPKVGVPADQDGHFEFTITPESGTTFSANPIYIQKGCEKPTGGIDSQIKNVTGGGTTTLKFKDLNNDPGPLTYVLNFADGSKLDPIIDNGGRPVPPPPPPPPGSPGTNAPHKAYLGYVGGIDLGAVLIGLIIGLIIGMILCRLSRRRSEALG